VTIWKWVAVLAVFGLGLAQMIRAFRLEPSSEHELNAGRRSAPEVAATEGRRMWTGLHGASPQRLVNAALLFSLAVLLAGFLGGAA